MDIDFAFENFPRLLKATKLTIELTFLSMQLFNKLEKNYSKGY